MNDLLLYALIITLEPLPIVAFILVLSTDGGARNGAGFIVGWVACLLVMIGATLALTGGEPLASSSAPATATLVVQVLLGLGLVGYGAYKQRHPHPVDAERPTPSWMKRLDRLSFGGAALLGVLMQPWAFVAAGATSITQADVSKTESIVLLVLFCLIATASLLAMEAYTVIDAEAARAKLDALQSWVDRNRDMGIIILAAGVGLYLVVKGAVGLITA
ncbi:MAG: GAP family protein [Acidimicrobiales bacterium]